MSRKIFQKLDPRGILAECGDYYLESDREPVTNHDPKFQKSGGDLETEVRLLEEHHRTFGPMVHGQNLPNSVEPHLNERTVIETRTLVAIGRKILGL